MGIPTDAASVDEFVLIHYLPLHICVLVQKLSLLLYAISYSFECHMMHPRMH